MYTVPPAFVLSCGLRPIRAFEVSSLLEVYEKNEKRRLFIGSEAKQLWFHQYCAEKGVKGKIDSAFIESTDLQTVPSEEYFGGVAGLRKEYWTATVYMDGEAVATATASEAFVINDRNEREIISAKIRNKAIGAALSQAGFGVMDGFDMSPDDIQRLANPESTPQEIPGQKSEGNAIPTPATATPSPQQILQDTFFNSNPAPKATTATATLPTIAPPPTPAIDPLTAAKLVSWQGKPLGTILGEPNGRKQIKWLASDGFKPREGQEAIKAAAQTIMASLQTGE